MKIIHTGDYYLKIDEKNQDFCRAVSEIFEDHEGQVPLPEFKSRLVHSFSSDPSYVVVRKTLESVYGQKSGNAFYPIRNNIVFEEGCFRDV